jgi:hypothetical protein
MHSTPSSLSDEREAIGIARRTSDVDTLMKFVNI